jgi:1-deoxy-D-xylulose-5-phosphate synthase
VGRFEPETGCLVSSCAEAPTYTEAFGQALIRLAEHAPRVIAITAAMPEGTGLTAFAERFPERFFDVGICEQHAVTFAAGMATQGLRPFVAIYSTFMQRSYDQIIHDVCIQNLPVTFCLDRAGLVGEDGPTHQGAFDVAYLRHIPNMTIFAPKDEAELQLGLATALVHPGPFALRYPRGAGVGAPLPKELVALEVGQAEYLHCPGSRKDVAVIALGSRVCPALAIAHELDAEGIHVAVLNARWAKPLPEDALRRIAHEYSKALILEESVLAGGFSSAVLEFLNDAGLLGGLRIRRLGLPDVFVEHGPAHVLRRRLGIDRTGIRQAILDMVAEKGRD